MSGRNLEELTQRQREILHLVHERFVDSCVDPASDAFDRAVAVESDLYAEVRESHASSAAVAAGFLMAVTPFEASRLIDQYENELTALNNAERVAVPLNGRLEAAKAERDAFLRAWGGRQFGRLFGLSRKQVADILARKEYERRYR